MQRLSRRPLFAIVTAVVFVVPAASSFALGAVTALRHPALAPEALMASSALLLALYPLTVRVARRAFDVFEPIVPASLFLAVLFGARPLTMIYTDDVTYFGEPLGAHFRPAVALGLLGVAAFVVAYEVLAARPLGARQEGHAAVRDPRAAREFAILGTLAGTVLFVVHLSRGPSVTESLRRMLGGRSQELGALYSSTSEYFSSAPILAAGGAIALLAVLGSSRLSRGDVLLLFTVISCPVAIFGLTGGRRFIIPCLLVPLIVYYLARGRRPRLRTLLVVAPLAFLLLATVPLLRSAGARDNAGGVVPLLVQQLTSPGGLLTSFVGGYDTEGAATLALQIEALDESEAYTFGRATVGDVLLAPIPSVLYPSKPTTARNAMLIDVFGHPCEPIGRGCPNFSVVGTFYQDFWYPGVVVGMAFLGAFSAALWRRWLRRPGSAPTLAAVACWIVFLPILMRAGFMPPFAWFLYFLVPSILGIWLAGLAGRSAAWQAGPSEPPPAATAAN